MREVEFRDLGVMPYGECWQLQQELFQGLVENKKRGSEGALQIDKDGGRSTAKDINAGYILMVEHPAVYTLGKSGKDSNMLLGEDQLKAIGADYYHIDRGGDVTFHGKGQIVVYPILDLEVLGIGLKEYIWALEEAVIATAANWDIPAQRIASAAGVWVKKGAAWSKICAIGVKSSRYITMHGLAMNVETDLKYFDYINPCGFTDRGATSLAVESSSPVSLDEAKELLLNNLIKILNVKIYKK
ncbi:MAG: lipoyl(octanoyl) transferase LipB [Rikenellaceae bacterium]